MLRVACCAMCTACCVLIVVYCALRVVGIFFKTSKQCVSNNKNFRTRFRVLSQGKKKNVNPVNPRTCQSNVNPQWRALLRSKVNPMSIHSGAHFRLREAQGRSLSIHCQSNEKAQGHIFVNPERRTKFPLGLAIPVYRFIPNDLVTTDKF